MSEKLSEKIDFKKLLQTSISVPLVHIDREDFLQRELKKYCTDDVIKAAIEYNPAYAGISADIINKIADSCINYETLKVSSISFASGLPGGFAIAATIPADLTQYYAHILRIMQKLTYLYGWQNLIGNKEQIDDETSQLLTLFTGVMFGVKGATLRCYKIKRKYGSKNKQNFSIEGTYRRCHLSYCKKSCNHSGRKND